jgi:hypothetical protein
MTRALIVCSAAIGLVLCGARPAAAQIYVTPALGAFLPASDLDGLQQQATQARLERSATLGLGLNVEFGTLRGSLAYASGATINDRSIDGRDNIGDGTVLAVAADVVLRPLPRLLVQPYALVGGGLKRQDFSFDESGLSNPLPRDRTDFAVHVGLGADVMLGGVGVMVEISDYISRNDDNMFGQHDAFALVGLRVRLGR